MTVQGIGLFSSTFDDLGVCTCVLQSTYIPLLPSGLLDFLHSPVPYIAGCHLLETTEEWPDACFYNIDDDRISAPAESRRLNEHSIPNGVELCKLLRTAKQRFNALRTTGKPWYEISGACCLVMALAW